ncbi:TIGR04283 family arsenosugar biosynthesis glycosyltransferase [Rubripirellula lacrimiformis]|uniref:TIGR04283 family arsenosugar biosynthesis glycosyltransferase n=1 Tax=Rubripirellula lacrimiformis TaxID=1930273 RepID=UPI001C54D114|nr:TIGR04283 family arsenosugar biosynthesis glycosyltransferase [Rubripirellula lacrimiformis]
MPLTPASFSIIIPTLDEAATIAAAIRSAIDAGAHEIIVTDGGSRDETIAVATRAGASKVVRSLPGRGTQQNAGAAVATRDWMLFLHADNRLHPDGLKQACDAIGGSAAGDHPILWGAMRQRIESPEWIFRAIEGGNAARVRVRGIAFGDQGIFVRSDVFRREGGFPDIPLMEDIELSRKLRRQSRPVLIPGPLTISPRRWRSRGPIRQTLQNWRLQIAHATGTSPAKLARRYQNHPH